MSGREGGGGEGGGEGGGVGWDSPGRDGKGRFLWTDVCLSSPPLLAGLRGVIPGLGWGLRCVLRVWWLHFVSHCQQGISKFFRLDLVCRTMKCYDLSNGN